MMKFKVVTLNQVNMLNKDVQALKELAQSLNRAHEAVKRESCDLSIRIKLLYGKELKPSQVESICEDLGVNYHTVKFVANDYFLTSYMYEEAKKLEKQTEEA